jgi:hypothetical protein
MRRVEDVEIGVRLDGGVDGVLDGPVDGAAPVDRLEPAALLHPVQEPVVVVAI